MFPEVETTEIEKQNKQSSGTKSYLFDFSKGDFVVRDGKLVECDGIEAIKVWIEKILRTEKGRFSIYNNTEYGCHLEDLVIGNNYTAEFVEAELKREIEETLLLNPQISFVSGFNITRDSHSITVTMEVYTIESGANLISVTV